MGEARPYNLQDYEERKRWFHEMEEYLEVEFLEAGTDFEGREYAYKAFFQLQAMLTGAEALAADILRKDWVAKLEKHVRKSKAQGSSMIQLEHFEVRSIIRTLRG